MIGLAAAGPARRVAASGVDQADHVAASRRLAPAHVPPDGDTVAEHAGKVAILAATRAPRSLERRASVGAAPADAAVRRTVHHVLPGAQAAAAFVHCRHVNPATALQVAGDLDVADEAGVEWYQVPSSTVIGVDHIQCAAPNVEIVVGDIHPPVEGAARVVVHPHALAVIAAAAVSADSGGPSDAVRRGPEANALAAAAGRQVAGKPHAQARVVHHDRVAKVGAMAHAKRLPGVPGNPVISRVGKATVADAGTAAVIVVDDPGVIGATPFHALRLRHFGRRAVREDDVHVGAADEQRLWQQALDQPGDCAGVGCIFIGI